MIKYFVQNVLFKVEKIILNETLMVISSNFTTGITFLLNEQVLHTVTCTSEPHAIAANSTSYSLEGK